MPAALSPLATSSAVPTPSNSPPQSAHSRQQSTELPYNTPLPSYPPAPAYAFGSITQPPSPADSISYFDQRTTNPNRRFSGSSESLRLEKDHGPSDFKPWMGASGKLAGSSNFTPVAASPLGPGPSLTHSRTPSTDLLAFKKGPPPKTARTNTFSRIWFRLLASHYGVRLMIYIVPPVILFWIPGIIGLTGRQGVKVMDISLLRWSCWLTAWWVLWWCGYLCESIFFLLTHAVSLTLQHTLAVAYPNTLHYLQYISAIEVYLGACGWAISSSIAFAIIMGGAKGKLDDTLQALQNGLIGLAAVLVILAFEKLSIQIITYTFHQTSHKDRIEDQHRLVATLTALYARASEVAAFNAIAPERPEIRHMASDSVSVASVRKALHATKRAAQQGAKAAVGPFGSPKEAVKSMIMSRSRSRNLAEIIYSNLAQPDQEGLLLADVTPCFASEIEATRAFRTLDKDNNGDCSAEELEQVCLSAHSESIAIASSMHDIAAASRNLDQILVGLWVVAAVIVVGSLITNSFSSVMTGVGAGIIGISWLVQATAEEYLASTIFVFVKHAYDVGDRVEIEKVEYVVVEMTLLQTVFRRNNGSLVQISHVLLNDSQIKNIRRSGAISEEFVWDVDFDTSFEKIEALRSHMLEFLSQESRLFLHQMHIAVSDFSSQEKLTLSTDIRYKHNGQNHELKEKSRNKWCRELKLAMRDLRIYGPGGVGGPPKTPHTADPWSAYGDRHDMAEHGGVGPAPKEKVPGEESADDDEVERIL